MCGKRITKLEAAKRQMDEAIRLFFERRDCVATHSLASAAAQVLSDLCDAKGIPSPIRGAGVIKEKHRKEWLSRLKAAENFFKHGDRDSEGTLEFRPKQTEGMLFDATYMYASLTKRQTYAGAVFQSWFFLKHPDFLLDANLKQALLTQANRLQVTTDDWDLFADLLKDREDLPTKILEVFD